MRKHHRRHLTAIAKYLIKKNIEGSYVECGVAKGRSAMHVLPDFPRPAILFDTWTSFPGYHKNDLLPDQVEEGVRPFLENRIKNTASYMPGCCENLTEAGVIDRCTFIQGDILETVPAFAKKKRAIAFLHSDVDLYEPTLAVLKHFWPLVVEGGVMYIHDYRCPAFPGVETALHEYLDEYGGELFPLYDVEPEHFAAFMIKSDAPQEIRTRIGI